MFKFINSVKSSVVSICSSTKNVVKDTTFNTNDAIVGTSVGSVFGAAMITGVAGTTALTVGKYVVGGAIIGGVVGGFLKGVHMGIVNEMTKDTINNIITTHMTPEVVVGLVLMQQDKQSE